jgi:hypothetical protein
VVPPPRDEDPAAERVRAVVADVGGEAASLDVAGWLDALGRAATGGERLQRAAVQRLTAAGGRAAAGGLALPVVVDSWLTSGWVLWRGLARDEPIEGHARLASALLRALDDGAKALAEGFVREQQRAVERNEEARLALLDGLLGGAAPDAVMAAAARVGVDLQGRCAVLVVDDVSETVLHRLREAGALAAPRDGVVVAVVGDGRAPRGPEAAGLGRPGLGVDGIRASYGEALRALEVARRLGLRGVVPYEEVRAEALIMSDRAALADLVATTLGPLEGGRQGAGPLIATLEAWLGSGTSVAATARALGLHERSVRYRLQRVEELADLDLGVADDRFRVELALRGRRLLAGPEG